MIRGIKRHPALILSLAILLIIAGVSAGEAALSRPGPADEPTRVDYGVYVVDVGNIDGANQNFTASVALALRWKDPRLASETGEHRRIDLEDVWHPRVMILNQQGVEETLPRVVEIEPDGTVSYVQRYWGQFSNPLRLDDFPFDHHEFEIRVLALGYTPEEINLSPIT